MSLVFNAVANEPQTHVIIIGIGGYPFLKGGETAQAQNFEAAQNLGQLTSPAVSVGLFYEKVMDYHNKGEWTKPLGSVEVLLSLPPGVVPPVSLPNQPIEKANLNNIRAAYFNWKTRCDASEENVALFFYCGHGLEKNDHFLLTEDFGQNPANPWTGSFNFDATKLGFRSCKAKTQVFFVDACRQITSDMLQQVLIIPPIDNPGLNADSKNNLTMKATASTQAAYGKINEATYFTQALVSGLDGLVARKVNNKWLVETSGLSAHIPSLMELVSPPVLGQDCQVTIGGSIDILNRNSEPSVWLEVSCDPDHALAVAELSCNQDGLANPFTRAPQPDPWKINLKAGIYKISAKFQNGAFANKEQPASATPPITKEKINCSL